MLAGVYLLGLIMISLVPEYGTHEYVRWRSYVTADSLRSIVDVTDTFAMQTLRNVLLRANVPIDLARSSTEQVLQFAARCVNFGELVLVVDAKQGRHTNQWISSHDLARGHARASSAVMAPPVEEPDETAVKSLKAASNIRDFTLTLNEEYYTVLGMHAVLVDGTRYKLTTDLGEVREGTVRGGEIKEAKIALDQSALVEIIKPK